MERIDFQKVDFKNFEISDEYAENVLLEATRKIYLIKKNEKSKTIQDQINLIFLNAKSIEEFIVLIIHHKNLYTSPPYLSEPLIQIAIEDQEELNKLTINEDPEQSIFGEFSIPDDREFYTDMLESVKNKYLLDMSHLNVYDLAIILQAMNMDLISNWSTFVLLITAASVNPHQDENTE